MTTEITKPARGAKLATKRRIIPIIILLLCSFIFVFWHERPILTIHNSSTEPLLYLVTVNNKEMAVGTITANTDFIIELPFLKARNAAIYFQAKTKDKIISSMVHTGYLGAINLYIRPDLSISMEPTPLGFVTEQQESDPIIVK